jgi:hypothetical protein
MRRGSRLVGLLWRWHRRLGVVAAAFVLMLSVTGIVLNHTPELGLDRRFIDWPWLIGAYGDGSADLPAFKPGAHWLYRAANGQVYFDATEVAPCNGELIGALQAGDMLIAACREEVLLITPAGELVETISASTGLAVPLRGVGLVDGDVFLQTADSWFLADLDRMDFSEPAPGGVLIQQLAPGVLPQAIRRDIPAQESWLTWERLLLDLHSGRVIGPIGVLIVDAIGVVLAVLAMSGLAMWWLHRRRRRPGSSQG